MTNNSLLHPSLRLLLRLQQRARWRKMKRAGATTRGKLSILAMLAVLLLWFGPLALMATFGVHPDPVRVRPILASGFFALTLLTVLGNGPEGGIFFFPAEVDLLFPAPLKRRDLLVYRIFSMLVGFPMFALFGSVLASRFVSHGVFAFLGIFLTLAFNYLLGMALGLAISVAGQGVYGQARKLVLAVCAVLVAIGVAQAAALDSSGWTLSESIRQFAATLPGVLLFAPFEVFARTVAAEHLFPDFIIWATLAIGMNVAFVALALRLDANFLESSAAASEKTFRKLQRARSGHVWVNAAKPSAVRSHLPMPGRWRGAGPVAWRQAVSALRGLRGILYSLLALVAVAGIQVAANITMGGSGSATSVSAVAVLSMMTVMFLPQMLRFDFRGDLERIDMLKTLPVSCTSIAIGELVVPVVLATVIELLFALALGLGRWEPDTLLAVCLLLPVANMLIFGIENLVLLWYPRPLGAPGSMDLQGGASRMITSFLKMLVMVAVAFVAAMAGVGGYLISGGGRIPAFAAAWVVAAAAAIIVVPLLARAFKQFDPSRDTAE